MTGATIENLTKAAKFLQSGLSIKKQEQILIQIKVPEYIFFCEKTRNATQLISTRMTAEMDSTYLKISLASMSVIPIDELCEQRYIESVILSPESYLELVS
jgi:hypothetical protein